MLSGAIHLMGSFPRDAVGGEGEGEGEGRKGRGGGTLNLRGREGGRRGEGRGGMAGYVVVSESSGGTSDEGDVGGRR